MYRTKTHSSLLGLILLFGILAGVTGCAGKSETDTAEGPNMTRTIEPATASDDRPRTEVATDKSAALANAGRVGAVYGIGPGDELKISVFEVPNLSTTAQVGADGTILFPLIGTVSVAGKTTVQAANEIADRLGQKYLQSPQVSVFVSHSAQRVSVNGSVQRPGVITLDGNLTLSQAVAEAGGTSDVADENRVHVARVRPDQTLKDSVYDLEAIKGGTARDPQLQSGDIVVVEKSGMRTAYKTLIELAPVIGAVATIALYGGGL